jgi:Protein of unknown function (DUF2934)
MANKKTEMPGGDRSSGLDGTMPTEAGGTAADRANQIATAAFLRAASRNFIGGDPVEDWLQAEMEVDAVINARSRSL